MNLKKTRSPELRIGLWVKANGQHNENPKKSRRVIYLKSKVCVNGDQ